MINDGFEYRERLGLKDEGRSVLVYLTERYAHSTASEWSARIESGQILVDSERVGTDTVIRRGQILVWRRPPWNEPDVPRSFSILFEDDDLLAVFKPAGLPTLPGAGFLQSTLLFLVRGYDPAASPLHRLGRWTSGIVLFSRTRCARARMTRGWSEVSKQYRALAEGDPSWSESTITAPIGRVPHALLGTVYAASADGRPSRTHIVVVERRSGAFLCDAFLGSGRPHQIRIHLAAAGHPLLGDPLYGPGAAPRAGSHALPGDPGYLLHASSVAFDHPRTGLRVTIACEPPPALNIGRSSEA